MRRRWRAGREGAPTLKVVHDEAEPNQASGSVLDEIVREAARQMLAFALQAEVSAYIDAYAEEVDENGHRLVGTSHGLSAATITRLTKDWQDKATTFNKRSRAGTDYALADRLPLVGAQILVVLLARSVLVMALFALVRRGTGSGTAGGLAVLLYAASPQFYFLEARFSHQAVATALLVALACLLVRSFDRGRPPRRGGATPAGPPRRPRRCRWTPARGPRRALRRRPSAGPPCWPSRRWGTRTRLRRAAGCHGPTSGWR
jgi:hypothetical protein